MSVLLVLTTVNNSVPTLQEALPVDVILDIVCWLMDISVKVLVHTNIHATLKHAYIYHITNFPVC